MLKRLAAPNDHAAAGSLADMDRKGDWRVHLGKQSPRSAAAGVTAAASSSGAAASPPARPPATPPPAAGAAKAGSTPPREGAGRAPSGAAAAGSQATPAAASPGATHSFTTEQLSRVLRDNPELMDVLKRTLEAKQQ